MFHFTNRLHRILSLTLVCCVAVFGCSNYNGIPKSMKDRVNTDVSLDQLKASPSSHQGELVVLGGKVLNVKRLEDKTRIEALALPLSEELVPMTDREQSDGRFYAFDTGKEILDPKVLEEGTPITVVGEVMGTTSGKIDEATYEYPTLQIRDLTKWNKMDASRWGYRYPYYGGYYWGAYRPYAFGYY
jgi:outer membrane lipoprotein